MEVPESQDRWVRELVASAANLGSLARCRASGRMPVVGDGAGHRCPCSKRGGMGGCLLVMACRPSSLDEFRRLRRAPGSGLVGYNPNPRVPGKLSSHAADSHADGAGVGDVLDGRWTARICVERLICPGV